MATCSRLGKPQAGLVGRQNGHKRPGAPEKSRELRAWEKPDQELTASAQSSAPGLTMNPMAEGYAKDEGFVPIECSRELATEGREESEDRGSRVLVLASSA